MVVAVVDKTGKLLDNVTIYPHAPQNHWDKSLRTLAQLCRQHKVELVAIGNGTGSRETDKLIAEVIELTNVDLSWDDPDGADFYSVYRNGSHVTDVNTNSYFDQELDCGEPYEYEVTASNGAGESSSSEPANITFCPSTSRIEGADRMLPPA